MGSWGYGPFDNDSAADLLAFVEEAGRGGWKIVREALQSSYPEDAVGAAELVATALGLGTRRDDRAANLAVGRQKAVPVLPRAVAQVRPQGSQEATNARRHEAR